MSFFDNEAMLYDEWYKTKMGNFVDEVETKCVFDLLKIKPGTKVLDVGCGTGNFSMKLARMGCKVTAIDISEEMLKVGKTKAKKENLDIQFYNMNVYDLQFEANCFDAVISVTAFEFIKDTKRAIEEMFRVLNDNGQMVIGTINKDSQWGDMYLSKEFQENTVFKYAVFKTEEDLKQLKPDKLKDITKCLFISPSAKEEEISLSKEKELFKHNKRGGFVCALWEK
ncbi:MAG: class I SAM-dependent methyltransferase [Clostridiaceae bacterium]|nr:class I SAM-dependent methyltransferase [Clostridiaceae bacterium]MBW4860447.1 class I SAM-dependent methyltransferase [Clostridiaceae bacterium]MBW4868363.1 class I SAM-dependent methyltransferase [Clostridiaceae bacterium]